MHARVSERGQRRGAAFSSVAFAAAARTWQATQGHSTAKSGFPMTVAAAVAASSLVSDARIESCRAGPPWMVGLRRCVVSALVAESNVKYHTPQVLKAQADDLEVPVTRGKAVRYILPVHGVAGLHSKKCGEGIRIAAPDSNFGRLAGWQWVGAGPGLLGRVQSTGSQRAREPAPVVQAPCSGPPSLRHSQHPVSPSTAFCFCSTARSPPTHPAGPPVPAQSSPASTLALWHPASHVSPARCVCACLPVCLSVPGCERCVCVCVSAF